MENAVEIYPNPASKHFHIKVEMPDQDEAEIKIYNVLGKVVYETEILTGSKIYNIDFSEKAKGIYYMQLQTQEGSITKKVVIIW